MTDEIAHGDPTRLKAQRRQFCREFIIDGHPYKAARRAGYSVSYAKKAAQVFLGDPDTLAMIAQLQDDNSELARIRGDEVVAELAKLAFTNAADIVSWDEDEGIVMVKSSAELPPSVLAAISTVKQKKFVHTDSTGEEQVHIHLEVKMYDKLSALDKLARIKGLYEDTTKLDISDGLKSLMEAVDGKTHGKLPSQGSG